MIKSEGPVQTLVKPISLMVKSTKKSRKSEEDSGIKVLHMVGRQTTNPVSMNVSMNSTNILLSWNFFILTTGLNDGRNKSQT